MIPSKLAANYMIASVLILFLVGCGEDPSQPTDAPSTQESPTDLSGLPLTETSIPPSTLIATDTTIPTPTLQARVSSTPVLTV